MTGVADGREVVGLGPAQWPIYVAVGGAVVHRRTTLTVPVDGIAPDVLATLAPTLASFDACCLSLLDVAGLQVPVQRREPAPRFTQTAETGPTDADSGQCLIVSQTGPPARLTVSLPAVVVDGAAMALLWDQIRRLLATPPATSLPSPDLDLAGVGTGPDLDLLDVAQWQREEAEEDDPGAFGAAFRAVLAARTAADGHVPDYEFHDCPAELLAAAGEVPGRLDDVLGLALLLALPEPEHGEVRHLARLFDGRGIDLLRPVLGRLDALLPVPVGITGTDTVATAAATVAAVRDRSEQRFQDSVVAATSDAVSTWRGLVEAGAPVVGVAVEPTLTPLTLPSGQRVVPVVTDHDPGPADLLLLVGSGPDGDRLRIRHDPARVGVDPADLAERLGVVLRQLADPQRTLAGITRIGPRERARLGAALTGSRVADAGRTRLDSRILGHAATSPDRVALRDGGTQLTYRQLAAGVTQVAARLDRAGVRAGDLVAVDSGGLLPFVTGSLAVLGRGAAFVPLDPAAPAEHRRRLLDRIGVRAVLGADGTAEAYGPGRGDLEPIPVSPVDPLRSDPAAPAYLLFTSGSTGVPNPVLVPHRALSGYAESIIDRLGLDGDSVGASPAAFTADLGITTLWPVLAAGGQVVGVAPEARLDADRFAAVVEGAGVTVLKITPSHLSALLATPAAARCLPSRTLVLGGEPLSRQLADQIGKLAPQVRIVNHYGPTETTVGVSAGPVDADEGAGAPTVGTPLPHARLVICDHDGQPVPAGHRGTLAIGGAGLALGYLGDPRLTAARFRPDPDATHGERVYLSGDLASVGPDGRIRLHGRDDDQVKIRGWRVDPAQCAQVLREHPAVRDAAVVAVGVGGVGAGVGGADTSLVAFAVVTDGTDVDPLLRFVADRAPEHLVPARLHLVDALPRLGNGKVDRAELRRRAAAQHLVRVGPRTDLEFVLATIWSELMNGVEVDVTANLFAAGAHSLLVTQALGRLRELLDVQVGIDAFFRYPSIESFAAQLASGPDAAALHRRAATVAQVLRMTDEQVDDALLNHAEGNQA